MNFDAVFEYAAHFLQTAVDFLASPLGVVVIAMGISSVILYFFEDVRR